MPEQLTQDLCLHFVILERKGEKNLKDVENDRVGPFLRFHSLQEIFQNGTFTILFMAEYQNENKNLNFILTSEASLFKSHDQFRRVFWYGGDFSRIFNFGRLDYLFTP